jgi:hypothetical protein
MPVGVNTDTVPSLYVHYTVYTPCPEAEFMNFVEVSGHNIESSQTS